MTDFNAAAHPRVADGTFTEKHQSAPELGLADPNLTHLPIDARTATAIGVIAAGGHHALFVHDADSGATVDQVVDQISIASGDKHVVTLAYDASTAEIIEAMKDANGGILYIPDAPEIAANSLDLLRQPLESGVLTIHRANQVSHFDAKFQIILGAKSCPCGRWGTKNSDCTCSPFERRRYLSSLSGPIVDRLAVQVNVASGVKPGQSGTTTEEVSERAARGRALASTMLAETPWKSFGEAAGTYLRGPIRRLPVTTTSALDRSLERGGITMRGYDRILRMAFTLATEDGREQPTADDIIEALSLRKA